jgi:hypothetical protein
MCTLGYLFHYDNLVIFTFLLRKPKNLNIISNTNVNF